MSCDGNRTKYFAHVCAPGSAAAAAFGGQAADQAALEQIFATARSQPVTDAQLPKLAEISTRALFARMQVAQLKPPTHSASGLPRSDAQRGYHAVWQTLEALKRGRTLPPLARQVQAARQEQRTIDARGLNAIGRLHCTSCLHQTNRSVISTQPGIMAYSNHQNRRGRAGNPRHSSAASGLSWVAYPDRSVS